MTQCHHIGPTPPHTGNRLDSHQCQRGTGNQNHHGHRAHPAHHSNRHLSPADAIPCVSVSPSIFTSVTFNFLRGPILPPMPLSPRLQRTCVHLLRHVSVVPLEPVRQKLAFFGNEQVGRRCLRQLVETLIVLGHHVAGIHLRMEEHTVQLFRLNQAAHRGPVFAWLQQKQGADVVIFTSSRTREFRLVSQLHVAIRHPEVDVYLLELGGPVSTNGSPRLSRSASTSLSVV